MGHVYNEQLLHVYWNIKRNKLGLSDSRLLIPEFSGYHCMYRFSVHY